MPTVTTQIKVYLPLLFVTLLAVLSSSLLNAADREKENRIATQSLQTLFVGEPIWLKRNKVEESSEFLGLLTTSSVAQFSIIMVHGTGQGPDTSYLIGPLSLPNNLILTVFYLLMLFSGLKLVFPKRTGDEIYESE